MLKRDKQELKNMISTTTRNAVSGYMNNIRYGTVENVTHAVESAIIFGITMAIDTLVDNLYSNEEFEEDLGLTNRPGPKS